MRIARWVAMAAAVATVAAIGVAGPAGADSGAYLRAGDVVCTDQVQNDASVRTYGTLVNGTGAFSLRMASTVGGPETEIWRAEGRNLSVSHTLAAPAPGRYFRSCLTVSSTASTAWYRLALSGIGAGGQVDLGPHTAVLSPGARACGDFGTGPVHLSGTADGPVQWSVFGSDNDYAFVGEIFSRTGPSVAETFAPGPDISLEEMCVTNTSATRTTASFELTPW